uniref:Uncharacterized protein n=1 Tax=Macrostomum lignano TaxID=282301 RepID=A0A1I8HRG7_9PLAT
MRSGRLAQHLGLAQRNLGGWPSN